MAEIKIEKKGGSRWWLWLLIALAVIAILLWALLGTDDDAAQNVATPVETSAPAEAGAMAQPGAPAGEPITDLATITGNTDGSLVGREVRLNGVPVGDNVGDASFWVNGTNGDRVYVVLDEQRTPNTQIEGRVDIDPGDTIDLVGTLRSAEGGAPTGAAIGTQTDPLPTGVTQYIYAQSANVAN